MKKQTQQRVKMASAAIALAAIVIPPKAQAIFGFGDIVFDPTSFASLGEIVSSDASLLTKAVELGTQTGKILTNAAATYAKIDQASHMVQNRNPTDWIAIGNKIEKNMTPDNSGAGASNGWSEAMNGAGDITKAYAKVTEGVEANSLHATSVANHDSLAASLASTDIADGAMVGALRTISTARANQATTDQAIRNIEQRANSAQDADNTQEASLNVIGGATVQQLRMEQSQQALMATIAEQQVPMNKFWRDSTVADINARTERQKAMQSDSGMPGDMTSVFK